MAKQALFGFLYDAVFLDHFTGKYHPEVPARVSCINTLFLNTFSKNQYKLIPVRCATINEIELVHPLDYIRLAESECEMGYAELSTGDTVICPESFQVALQAVGGVLNAVDDIFNHTVKSAFCAVRPPGHHASAAVGMGFCIFNNVAIAARYAQKKYQAEKILIIDWDVHHGNGTQEIFYSDGSVYYMSSHQSPWYPGTGHPNEIGLDKGEGFTLNRPFPGGVGDSEIIDTYKKEFLKEALIFHPDLVIISAGFDSHISDPLGDFNITNKGFKDLTSIMLDIADQCCQGRILSVLEGGYNLSSLPTTVIAHVEELIKF
jgi:acetoin utilization deacetylase AcuC-like enzyme